MLQKIIQCDLLMKSVYNSKIWVRTSALLGIKGQPKWPAILIKVSG